MATPYYTEVRVEAMQLPLSGDPGWKKKFMDVSAWAADGGAECGVDVSQPPYTLSVGGDLANPGDYIVRDRSGGFHVVNKRVFERDFHRRD